jgi:hypothetical protein
MKTKELMIGDRVFENTFLKQNCTVQVVEPDRVLLKEGKCYSMPNEVEQIPFSDELFEKNEFKRNIFNGTIIYSKKFFVDIDWYDVEVEIGKDAEGIQRWDCVCIKLPKAGANLTLYNQSCFHQLQHALRLVGLTEIADNLKV